MLFGASRHHDNVRTIEIVFLFVTYNLHLQSNTIKIFKILSQFVSGSSYLIS